MVRFIVLVVVLTLAGGSSVRGQDAEEVKRLKARIELLEAKLEAATLKIEKLERENQKLQKEAGKQPAGDAKPTHTDRMNAGAEEVEYVLEKVTRNGREVTVVITATLKKGPEKRTVHYYSANAVDADGKAHKSRINANASGKSIPEAVDLRAGVGTKMELRFPLAEGVTQLKTLEITAAAVERVAIKFSNLEVPK